MPGLCCYKEKFQHFSCPLWNIVNGFCGEGSCPQAIQKQLVSNRCWGDQPAYPLLLPVHRVTQKTGRGTFPVTTGETQGSRVCEIQELKVRSQPHEDNRITHAGDMRTLDGGVA